MSHMSKRFKDQMVNGAPSQPESRASRQVFEEWISGPPYEREIQRNPEDEMKYAWPGQYRDISVELAWEAWCESARVSGGLNSGEATPIGKQ